MDGAGVLDLEVAGEVRDLTLAETDVRACKVPNIKQLRDSHHTLAKLLTHGLTPLQASLQTNYSVSRILALQNDPMFRELMAGYRKESDATAGAFEDQMLLVAKDFAQAIHEELLDSPESIPVDVKADIFKLFADRAGFAPVTKSITKSINYNIGDKMDAARKRKEGLE